MDFASFDPWIAFFVCAGLVLVSAEFGYRIGVRYRENDAHRVSSTMSTLQASILGLLALIVGFTFSMALGRFEARRDAVLEEANAIGTAALRAQFLASAEAAETLDLFTRYTMIRLDVIRKTLATRDLTPFIQESVAIQGRIWSIARAAAQREPNSIQLGLYIQALNAVFDIHEKRITLARNHVPSAIVVFLFMVAVVALAFTGYADGLAGTPNRIPNALTALLIISIVLLVIDLDQPQRGFLQISQQPLVDTLQSLPPPKN